MLCFVGSVVVARVGVTKVNAPHSGQRGWPGPRPLRSYPQFVQDRSGPGGRLVTTTGPNANIMSAPTQARPNTTKAPTSGTQRAGRKNSVTRPSANESSRPAPHFGHGQPTHVIDANTKRPNPMGLRQWGHRGDTK